ncbi:MULTISPECIES: hypothetical protein [Streptomyces]|uniref:hypothetical protein n=1 Tax=Streptomyces TaxID=1883 RepID=UPI00117ED636|nr:hypothetical protein [Streptomyces kasugaensis]
MTGRKQARRIRIATAKPSNNNGMLGVELTAFGVDVGPDYDRLYKAVLSPDEARMIATQLTRWADWAEGNKKGER